MRIAATIAAVAAELGLTAGDLIGPDRRAHIVRARQIAAWLARHQLGRSYAAIGRVMGGRDHRTIMWAVARIDALRGADPLWRARIDRIRVALPVAPDPTTSKGTPAMIHIDDPVADHVALRLQLGNGWTVAILIPSEGDEVAAHCWASHEQVARPGIMRVVAAPPVTGDGLAQLIAAAAAAPMVSQRQPEGEAA